MAPQTKMQPAAIPMEERIRESVVGKLRQWVAAFPDPDQPIIGIARGDGGEEVLSPKQILRSVEERTAVGQEFVERWVTMVINHIDVSKVL